MTCICPKQRLTDGQGRVAWQFGAPDPTCPKHGHVQWFEPATPGPVAQALRSVAIPTPHTHCVECGRDLLVDAERASGQCALCATEPPALCERCKRAGLQLQFGHCAVCYCVTRHVQPCDCARESPPEREVTPEQLAEMRASARANLDRFDYSATDDVRVISTAQLLRDRAATWSRRSDKWHASLERERAWARRGRTATLIVSAAGAIGAALLSRQWSVVGGLVCTLIAALFTWRGQTAQLRLDTTRADQAWVIADRMAEHYRGILARLDDVSSQAAIGELKRQPYSQLATLSDHEGELLKESQRLEAGARFGLPDAVREALEAVTK